MTVSIRFFTTKMPSSAMWTVNSHLHKKVPSVEPEMLPLNRCSKESQCLCYEPRREDSMLLRMDATEKKKVTTLCTAMKRTRMERDKLKNVIIKNAKQFRVHLNARYPRECIWIHEHFWMCQHSSLQMHVKYAVLSARCVKIYILNDMSNGPIFIFQFCY